MYLKVEKIYHAKRLAPDGEDEARHFAELKAYLMDEVQPKGFKFERKGDELIVLGYCGEFVEE
jgi:hypothetical protein